jgi:hypothetical protein
MAVFFGLGGFLELPAQQRDRSSLQEIADSLGAGALAMAWPTASYKRAEFRGVRGDDLIFVVYGESAWGEGEIWVEVIYSLSTGKVAWGDYWAVLPPGTAGELLGIVLDEAMKESPPAQPSAYAAPTWTLTDGCRDGAAIHFRLHDVDHGLVWPDAEKVYVIPAGETRMVKLKAQRGAKICYGARPDLARSSAYWGIGTDGKQGCKDCCRSAGDENVAFTLTCD